MVKLAIIIEDVQEDGEDTVSISLRREDSDGPVVPEDENEITGAQSTAVSLLKPVLEDEDAEVKHPSDEKENQ